MTERITMTKLGQLCDRINGARQTPFDPYAKGSDGRAIPQPGCVYVDYANGGCRFLVMTDCGGAAHFITARRVTKRELYWLGTAYEQGFAQGFMLGERGAGE